jgi:hypothetical protein
LYRSSTTSLFQHHTHTHTPGGREEELGRYAYENTSKTRVERGERWTTTTRMHTKNDKETVRYYKRARRDAEG